MAMGNPEPTRSIPSCQTATYSECLVGDKNLIEAYNGSRMAQRCRGELGTLVGPEGMQLSRCAILQLTFSQP